MTTLPQSGAAGSSEAGAVGGLLLNVMSAVLSARVYQQIAILFYLFYLGQGVLCYGTASPVSGVGVGLDTTHLNIEDLSDDDEQVELLPLLPSLDSSRL